MLEEVCRLAYVDPADFYDARGKLLPVGKMGEDARRAIAGITLNEYGGVKTVKAFDKNASLSNLMRHLGMFKDKVEVEHTLSHIAERLVKARKRVKARA